MNASKVLKVSGLLLCGWLIAAVAYADSLQNIEKRIAPIGQVRTTEEIPSPQPSTEITETTELNSNTASTTPETTLSSAQVVKRAPNKIYEQYCFVCHDSGVAGAPRFQKAEDWKPRLTLQSMPEIVQSAIKGMNLMPPRGTCSDCTDEEIEATVKYLIGPETMGKSN